MNSRLASMGLLACLSYIDFAFGASEAKPVALADRIRILYEAPPSCPEKDTLVADVVERVTIAWIADETELARQIHVTIARAGTGYLARMEYVEEAGRQVLRSVNADDCDQAVGGIALIIALAIESQAVRVGSVSENVAARPTTMQETTLNLPPSHERPPPTLALRPAVASGASFVQPSPSQASLRWTHEAGIRMGATAGLAPGTALGAAVYWGIGHRPLPFMRLALGWFDFTRLSADPSSPGVHFALFTAQPQVCRSEVLEHRAGLSLAACGGVEAGLYRANGVAPESAGADAGPTIVHHHNLFWSSLLLSAPLRCERHGVFFELAPELRLPLVRGTFEFQRPAQGLYTIPWAAFGFGVASGLTFP